MDREILFRAKRVCNDEWIEGYYLNCYYPGNSTDQTGHFIVEYPGKYHEIYLETLCQYIGLTDKNGRKIFEGDILHFVNHSYNNKWLCVIEFLEGSFICRYIRKDGELGEYIHFNSWNEKVRWEVIGNIIDNPDLVKH